MEDKQLKKDLIGKNRSGQKVTQKKRVKIRLNTRLAKKLYRGHWNGAIGLPKFAGLVRRIWEASREDDPYADFFLLKIYDSVDRTRKSLQRIQSQYQKLLTDVQGLEVKPFKEEEPMEIPLYFSTPYAFMCSYALAQFDELMQVLITVMHLGLAPDKEMLSTIRRSAALVRSMQAMPLQWQKTGVTRQDILENNALAKKVKKLMGEVNPQVLGGDISPPNEPNKNRVKSTVSNDSKKQR